MITTLTTRLFAVALLIAIPAQLNAGTMASQSANRTDPPLVIEGTISATYISTATIMVATPIEQNVAIRIGPKTIIRKAGRRISMDDLKQGHRVMVMYDVKEGINVARSIVVQGK